MYIFFGKVVFRYNTFVQCLGSVLSKRVGSTSLNSRNGWLEYLETYLVLHAKFVEKIFPLQVLE